jgi:hypothetical protein
MKSKVGAEELSPEELRQDRRRELFNEVTGLACEEAKKMGGSLQWQARHDE